MRKFTAFAASALLLASLTGCASAEVNPDLAAFEGITPACAHYETGSASEQISYTLDTEGIPQLKFPTPLGGTTAETKVLKEGTGPAFTGNEFIVFDYQIVNGGTGELVQGSKFDGSDDASQLVTPAAEFLCQPLSGVKEGSLVAILLPAASFKDGKGPQDFGLGPTDSLILTIQLNKVALPSAMGDAQPQQDGFPQVVTDPATNEPGLVVADWSKPAFTEFKKATLIKGKGKVVEKGQTVVVNYSGWVWSSVKAKFDSSWANGSPVSFPVQDGSLIAGFIKALEGETVGSRVIAVIPPSEGYGDKDNGSIPADSTLIFVVDILAIK
ncbi:MAG: FKBP-type peptidyl-prolyl cis-trans isomerase [Micrococcales bacterium]